MRNLDQTANSKFTPDMVWIKNRDQTDDHRLVDIVRGVTKTLSPSDATSTEVTNSDSVMAFSDKTWIDCSSLTQIGNMTGEGGLAQAFDKDCIEGYLTCAAIAGTTGYALSLIHI